MTRLVLPVILAVSCALSGARAQNADEPRSRVVIDVVAVDRRGVPVLDLKQDEIEVWIGHFRVPIQTLTVVSPSDGQAEGRLIVLLMDDVTISPAVVPRAREAARRFVSRIRPGDQMMVTTLTGTISETSGEPARLRKALDNYNVRASGLDRLDVLNEHVLVTLASLARQLTEAPGRRKIVVAIGSGMVFDRPLPPRGTGRDVESQWIDAMRAMASAHMHLYVIDPTGVGAGPADGGENGFARATGGHAFLNSNDSTAAVDRILREASNYYLIGVSDPPVGRKSDLRELEVRVSRPGVTAIARRAIPGGS